MSRRQPRPGQRTGSHVLLRCQATIFITAGCLIARVRRLPQRRGDQGIVSVETIGWIGIAIAVVAVVGLIVKTKLTAMANNLPDTLGW